MVPTKLGWQKSVDKVRGGKENNQEIRRNGKRVSSRNRSVDFLAARSGV